MTGTLSQSEVDLELITDGGRYTNVFRRDTYLYVAVTCANSDYGTRWMEQMNAYIHAQTELTLNICGIETTGYIMSLHINRLEKTLLLVMEYNEQIEAEVQNNLQPNTETGSD